MRLAEIAPPDAIRPLTALAPPWPGRAVVLDGSVTYVRPTPPSAPGAQPDPGIAGTEDRLVDVRASVRLAGTIPGARLLRLRGVGHVAQMEVPEITARAMVALLDEYTATGAAGSARAQPRAPLIRPGESVA